MNTGLLSTPRKFRHNPDMPVFLGARAPSLTLRPRDDKRGHLRSRLTNSAASENT